MAQYYFVVALLVSAVVVEIFALGNDCPLASKMTTCSPKCKEDSECHGLKCCSNICNTKSCAPANLAGQGSDKYKQSGATGQYCGTRKCNSFEKCEMDRSSKQYKCVRG